MVITPKKVIAAAKYFRASVCERYMAIPYRCFPIWLKFGGNPLVSTAAIHFR